jgi:hypothetical protein
MISLRIAFAGLLCVVPCNAQQNACVAKLLTLVHKDDPKQYKGRPTANPDRCEGTYDPQRSTDPPLLLTSYTSVREPFDPAKDRNVQLSWSSPGNPGVRIRGYSLRRGDQLVYQMDAFRDPGKVPFQWPLDVVRDVGLQNPELGILGWAAYNTPRGSRDVYLPLEVTRSGTGKGTVRAAEILIMPSYSLNKVTLEVESLNADFSTAATLVADQELTDVSREANIPIRLAAKHLKITKTGYYYVSVGARITDGPSVALPFFLYYAQ